MYLYTFVLAKYFADDNTHDRFTYHVQASNFQEVLVYIDSTPELWKDADLWDIISISRK